MNKNDCCIVKDLSLGYIEETLNENTMKFVEKHLSECKECKEYYEAMRKNISEDNDTENDKKDKIEINYLKKVKKHINFLKIIIIVILICSIFTISFLSIKYYHITNIINQTYERTENMKKLDNYKLTKRTIYQNFLDNTQSFDVTYSYYYKDGKNKIEYGNNSTTYINDDSYNKVCVYDDLKQIEYYTQDFIEQRKGEIINNYWEISNYKKTYNTMDIIGLSIREEKYNNMDCYVLRRKSKNAYTDIWIDKETWTVIRKITEEKSKIRTEEIYSFSENKVTDNDVDASVLKTEKYKEYKILEIENKATEEIKLYNELMEKYEKY